MQGTLALELHVIQLSAVHQRSRHCLPGSSWSAVLDWGPTPNQKSFYTYTTCSLFSLMKIHGLFLCRILGITVPSWATGQTPNILLEFLLTRTLFSLRSARVPSAVQIMAWRWSGRTLRSTLTCTSQAGHPMRSRGPLVSKTKCNIERACLMRTLETGRQERRRCKRAPPFE